MGKIKFTDKNGSFVIENPENYSGLYLPLAGEMGLKSNITPSMAGDAKTDQNHFLLEPVSIENLHNNKNGRNFWCRIEGNGIWSVSGASALQEAEKFTASQDESKIEAGLMWQKLTRISKNMELNQKCYHLCQLIKILRLCMLHWKIHRLRVLNLHLLQQFHYMEEVQIISETIDM